jgi:hypothetical protein
MPTLRGRWNDKEAEGFIGITIPQGTHRVVALDCLQDWIGSLTMAYNELLEDSTYTYDADGVSKTITIKK